MSIVKWGVIGCGGIADRRTIPGLLCSPNAELVAVMDVYLQVAEEIKEKYNVSVAFDSVEELLAMKKIDAVYIASPVFAHKEQAILAAKAKKHILIEKPVGLTSAEAEEIACVCEEENVKIAVGMMMRYGSYHQAIKQVIESGKIGNLVSLRAQLTCWYPEMEGTWRQDKRLSGGGALVDLGVHTIDLLQYITGLQAEEVAAFVGNQTFSYAADDFASLLLKMNNGATAFVDSNFNIPDEAAKCRLEIYGEKGAVLAEGTIGQVDSGEVKLYANDSFESYDAAQNRRTPQWETITTNEVNMYEREITSFNQSILEDSEVAVSIQEAIGVQKIVEAAYQSSETGQVVKVDQNIKEFVSSIGV